MSVGARRQEIRFQAVLFDFDHTLFAFDDGPAWLQGAFLDAGQTLGLDEATTLRNRMWDCRSSADVERVLSTCECSTSAHLAAHQLWFRRAGLDEPIAAALYRRLVGTAGWAPYEDTSSCLRAINARGLAVGVVSNVGWDLRPTFATLGGDAAPLAFALSCELGVKKPAARPFLAACDMLGVEPAKTLMVGDDAVNDGSALEVGIHALLLPPRERGARRGLAAVLDLVDQLDFSV